MLNSLAIYTCIKMVEKIKSINFSVLFCGGLVVLLGASVIFGWHTNNIALVQVNPEFAPMQYNTALSFLLAGISVVCLVIKKHFLSRILGLAVGLIGIITLLEYVFQIDLGIDQALMRQDIMTKTSHPGRMAPSTALCFSLCGFALLFGLYRRAAMVSLAAAVLVLSVTAFVGYGIGEESIYGWGHLTRMAIHTASGFFVLSIGMMLYGILKQSRKKFDVWDLAPFSLAIIVCVITLLSWYSIKETAQKRNERYFNTLVMDTKDALLSRYGLYEQSLWGGLGLFQASTSVERDEWKAYVTALDISKNLPGIKGIGYIPYILEEDLPNMLEKIRADGAPDFTNFPETTYPDKFPITYIEPIVDNIKALGLDIGFEENRREAAERARDLGVPALTKKIELVQDNQKQPGFLLLLPLYETKDTPVTLQDKRKYFKGWIYAPFVGSAFLNGLTDISDNQISFSVYDGTTTKSDALIYDDHIEHEAHEDGHFSKQTAVDISGRIWTIEWHDTDRFKPPAHSSLSTIVLVFGLFFAGFLYFMLQQLVRRKAIIADEVERQTTELNKTRSQLELLLNSAGEGLYGLDLDGHTTFINKAAENILGYSLEDMLGTSEDDFIHKNHTNGQPYLQANSKVYAAFKNGITQTEDTENFWHKDGSSVPVEYTSTPIQSNGEITGAVLMFRDISERLEQQERIDFLKNLIIYASEATSQEEFLKIVLDTVCRYIGWPVGHAYLWDEKKKILKPSCVWYLDESTHDFSEFKRITEQTNFEDGQGLPGRIYNMKSPEWIEDVTIHQSFYRNTLLPDMNLRSGFGLPVFLNGNVPVVLEFYSPDIIEKDEELLDLWETAGMQLSRVIERGEIEKERIRYTKNLEKAKDQASRANIMKSEFLANMSYEIRTPLNGVIGAADLLKRTNISANQDKYLNIITGAGETLLALINDILDLSKIEAGELEINPEPTNIRALVNGAMHSISPKINDKDIEVVVHYKGNIPQLVMLDPVRFNQIMINLLGNAAKFVEEGYIAVHVEEKRVKKDKIKLRITIEDSGIGIPKNKLETIFEKFAQANSTTTKKYGGTGLGLAITQRLVELMKGKIGVESEVGVSTKFWFEMTTPIIEDRDIEKAEETITQIEDLRVLIVDDLPVSSEFLSYALESMRIECVSVQSAKEGLQALEDAATHGKPFDVALIDYHMPVMNGVELAQAIRKYDVLKNTKLILISDLGKLEKASKRAEDLIQDNLFNDYILKPIDAHDLRQKLYEVAIIGDNYVAIKDERDTSQDNMSLSGHILLVENEMVNQMVATDMLQSIGCTVDLAENGQEALDILADNKRKYDAILMDCMMPIMDGFEATQLIRENEKDLNDGTHQIIIAMTANAMAGEKDKCLAIGMDDYLSKPVKEKALYEKLKEYI